MEVRKICFNALLMLLMQVCVSCASKTEKAIEGYWESESYECESLPIELDLDVDITAKDLLTFQEKKFSLIRFYSVYGKAFAKASVSGEWSAYKDQGLNLLYNISTLEVSPMYEGIREDIIKGLKKCVMEELSLDNGLSKDEAHSSEFYNVEILSPKGSDIKSSMTLYWDSPIEYKRIGESDFYVILAHDKAVESSNAHTEKETDSVALECGSYMLKGEIGNVQTTLFIVINSNMGFNVRGSAVYANDPSTEYTLSGSYYDNCNLQMFEEYGYGENAKRTGEFKGKLIRTNNGGIKYKGQLYGDNTVYEFDLRGVSD